MKRIRKKEQSIGILGKITSLFSNSNKDAYSCDYVNKIMSHPKKGLVITSDKVELNGENRNFYIEDEEKITIFFSFKTKTGLTADVKYDITVNCPLPDTYYATTAYANPNNPILVGMFMMAGGHLQICPSENLNSSVEINGQITYFKKII